MFGSVFQLYHCFMVPVTTYLLGWSSLWYHIYKNQWSWRGKTSQILFSIEYMSGSSSKLSHYVSGPLYTPKVTLNKGLNWINHPHIYNDDNTVKSTAPFDTMHQTYKVAYLCGVVLMPTFRVIKNQCCQHFLYTSPSSAAWESVDCERWGSGNLKGKCCWCFLCFTHASITIPLSHIASTSHCWHMLEKPEERCQGTSWVTSAPWRRGSLPSLERVVSKPARKDNPGRLDKWCQGRYAVILWPQLLHDTKESPLCSSSTVTVTMCYCLVSSAALPSCQPLGVFPLPFRNVQNLNIPINNWQWKHLNVKTKKKTQILQKHFCSYMNIIIEVYQKGQWKHFQ